MNIKQINFMKGKIKLVPVTNPFEGKKVVWNGKIYELNGKRDFREVGYQDNYWLVGDAHTNVSYEPFHVFKELVIQQSASWKRKSTIHPLYHEQWDWALGMIDNEVEFDILTENCMCGATCWAIENNEKCVRKSPKQFASIITATPVRTIEDIPEELRKNYPPDFDGTNPCKKIELKPIIVDIEVDGQRVQFEGLNARQLTTIAKLMDFYSTRGVRRSAQMVGNPSVTQLGFELSEIINQDGDNKTDGEVIDEIVKLLVSKGLYQKRE